MHAATPTRVIPQANRLDKLAVVVDAVNAGANTDAAIAEALCMSGRQGSYYATAACSLGLVESDGNVPRSWQLTTSGQAMKDAAATKRAELLAALVSVHADTLAAVHDDAEDSFTRSGLAGSTAQRRAATAAAWLDQATDPEFAHTLAGEIDATTLNAAVASAKLQEQRAAKLAEAARKAARETRPACARCWIELPANGTCPDC